MTTKSVSIRKIQRAPRPTTGFVQPRIVWRLRATRILNTLGARPGTASRVASPCPQGGWAGHTMRRRRPPGPRGRLGVRGLECPVSWMSFVLDAGRRGSRGPRRFASWTALPVSWSSLAPLAPNAHASGAPGSCTAPRLPTTHRAPRRRLQAFVRPRPGSRARPSPTAPCPLPAPLWEDGS